MDFEINLVSLIKPFFQHDQKVMTKTLIFSQRKKEMKQITEIFWGGESPTLMNTLLDIEN